MPEAIRDDDLEREEPVSAAQDRASKAQPGRSKRRGSPKGQGFASKLGAKFVPGGGNFTQPLSPAEGRRFIWALDSAIGSLAGSNYVVDEHDPRVEVSGDALADISKWLPIVRIAPRVTAPLILAGQQVSLMRDILDAVPPDAWWRGRQPAPGWEPEVVPGRVA